MEMTKSPARPTLGRELDDLLGRLTFARHREDIGGLALLTYWEVRRWARAARLETLAEQSARVVTGHPHPTRAAFLGVVDDVINELESLRRRLH